MFRLSVRFLVQELTLLAKLAAFFAIGNFGTREDARTHTDGFVQFLFEVIFCTASGAFFPDGLLPLGGLPFEEFSIDVRLRFWSGTGRAPNFSTFTVIVAENRKHLPSCTSLLLATDRNFPVFLER